MSSVLDIVDCPQCHNPADTEYFCRSGEQWMQCSHCGYYYELTLIPPKGKQGKPRYKPREATGYGAAKYEFSENAGVQSRCSLNKKSRGKYVQWVLDNAASLVFATITVQQHDGTWREVALLGDPPNDEASPIADNDDVA